MIPAATSASTAASSSGSVSWPPQRARNASQAPAKHFFFSHISCPNFSKNLSRHSHRWCLQPVTSARSAGSYRNFPDDRKWGQNSQRESSLRSLSQHNYCHNKKQGARPGKEPLLSRKEKFSLYLTLEKKAIPERRYQEDGGRSLTAFIENAVDFYLDYLSANKAGLFLPASVKSCLDGRWDSWKIACLPCLQTGSGAGHGGWHPR